MKENQMDRHTNLILSNEFVILVNVRVFEELYKSFIQNLNKIEM